MKRIFKVAAFLMAGLSMLSLVSCGSKKSSGLVGAGATFPLPYYNMAFDAYKTSTGVAVNYGAQGSGTGIRSLADRQASHCSGTPPCPPSCSSCRLWRLRFRFRLPIRRSSRSRKRSATSWAVNGYQAPGIRLSRRLPHPRPKVHPSPGFPVPPGCAGPRPASSHRPCWIPTAHLPAPPRS